MSFVDLATLTLHRRHEMEGRISTFTSKCDTAINNIRKLKAQARTFVDKLNCEPSELKERFLTSMMKLDEYIYLMTEFNLSIENLEKNGSMELAPVHDNSYKNYPVMIPTNLMDVLSEPAPTPSTASANRCPVEKPQPRRRPRAQELILFSSTSCSAESVPEANTTVEKEVQCVEQEIQELTITDPTVIELPAQDTLDTGKVYDATIMSVDGSSLWIVTEPFDNVFNFLQEMTTYYEREENQVKLPVSSMPDCSYCAYFDAQDTQWYLRALLIKTTESGPLLFLVDTGEMRPVAGACLRLAAPHAARPPLARLCHLADVDLLSSLNKEGVEDYLKQFVGKPYTMKVDDNSSESLGVFVFVDGDATLNERLVQEGLATALDKPSKLEEELHLPTHGPPELAESADDEYGPEHDDPVEAVAGYSNRDEIDICKHYVGGPDKTCFKGLRCKKRHVLKHPDGWTLDRVAVPGKCRSLPLPAPGTWHKVVVTYVCHFDRLYVHFEQEKAREELPSFGVVLPPMTLDSLVRDMNSPATYAAFTPLQMAPAPGELVAAKYRDGLWYRARVTCATRADQCVEVIYIDYGNVISVKENEIMVLDRRFVALPAQAVLCRLAGVSKLADDSRQWAAAKARLTQLAQDQPMQAHIIARGYDELTVEMFDAEGHSLAQRLAEGGEVAYRRDYDVEDDTQIRRFKMPSITMKLLVFAVACVILVGTQTKTTQKRPTTREEMDKMVSRMMMRYPQNKSDLLVSGQKDGALEGPNLGYEPYWKNVYDIEWEDKCARCAKLFRRYTEVCAVDGTGEIVVNISMCGMMRQNCLKGFMRGHSVGNQKVDYALNTVVVADGWARLSIQQAKEASILLSSSVDRKPPYYQVMLDGFDGKKSQLYKNGESKPRTWYDNQHHGYWHQPLGTSEYEEFVIKWNSTSGDILITKSSYPNWWQGFYLMYTDPEPFNIRFISVSGYKNIKGNFTLKDFTVANVGPCGELAGGVPRPLPTSPTEVPPILGGYSVINWGYYTRLKEADVDKDKQYLSTREEY